MAGAAESMLEQTVALLAAAVIAVPVFRRLGFGSVLGYFAAGLVIGPFGLRLFDDPVTLLHVAELGVVMFLFIIGLEMRPARLWALRRSGADLRCAADHGRFRCRSSVGGGRRRRDGLRPFVHRRDRPDARGGE
jgi:hypothetical protein